MSSSPDTTRLLLNLRDGDGSARNELLTVVYNELRALAARHLRKERPDHTLQATALANEAYMRLVDREDVDWQGHAHFMALASAVIRRILIDHARRHSAAKRGGTAKRVRLSDTILQADGVDIDILALDEAMRELAALNERHHSVVELRFFGGLTIRETALVLGVSMNTVNADWQAARAWLRVRLLGERNP